MDTETALAMLVPAETKKAELASRLITVSGDPSEDGAEEQDTQMVDRAHYMKKNCWYSDTAREAQRRGKGYVFVLTGTITCP